MDLQPVLSLLIGCAASVFAGLALACVVFRDYNRNRDTNFQRLGFELDVTLAQLRKGRAS